MKGFLFKKDEYSEETKENKMVIKKSWENINTIKIINPILNNDILVIDSLIIETNTNISIDIYLEDEDKDLFYEKITLESYLNYEEIKALKIKNFNTKNQGIYSLLEEQIILLPGGQIIIRLNTPYIELSMWCNYIQESLQDS
ncbi:hypothetical protein [Clostridium grantii]|uniref:Uncharacterized protein n=1 Tax=Clostridium grantii DSM 8605 TaxID=1121316 RepID=A0A1M5XT93_9CLOT|nr:hypothetical protein [Clostridium grantii]SHI03031.1 hypothetical protein SAMN02745207_03923 [Clostridium grantii DSM 8605]